MSREKFSRREVERSFRKFNDIVNDLWSSPQKVDTESYELPG